MTPGLGKPLSPGVQARVLQETFPATGGMVERDVAVQTDSILVTLVVFSIAGGASLTVEALAAVGDSETPVITFPVITTTTSTLLMRRASVTTGVTRVRATATGACVFEVQARAVDGGLAEARILGALSLRTSQITVTTAATLLLPASLEDRSGLVIKHWAGAGDLYVGESALAASAATAYPLAHRDALALDVAAGVSIWGISSVGTIDVRIAEAGSG